MGAASVHPQSFLDEMLRQQEKESVMEQRRLTMVKNYGPIS
jgi:hypothetical protein